MNEPDYQEYSLKSTNEMTLETGSIAETLAKNELKWVTLIPKNFGGKISENF